MTARRPWEVQCRDKIGHASRRSARAHRQRLGRHKGERALHIYRCPWCGWFHVGHQLTPQPAPLDNLPDEATAPAHTTDRCHEVVNGRLQQLQPDAEPMDTRTEG